MVIVLIMPTTHSSTGFDRLLAKVCENCPLCRHARRKQAGLCYSFVRHIDQKICPFCRAYERLYGRKSHESLGDKIK